MNLLVQLQATREDGLHDRQQDDSKKGQHKRVYQEKQFNQEGDRALPLHEILRNLQGIERSLVPEAKDVFN